MFLSRSTPMAERIGASAIRSRWQVWCLIAVLLVTAAVVAASQQHRSAWHLVWSDNFNSTSLDTSKWSVTNASTFGDGNGEVACLMNRSENVFVAHGVLTLRAVREPVPLKCGSRDLRFPQGRSYSSAMLSTKGKASWHEGRFEVRARLPLAPGASKGLWPAFWLRPQSGPGDGELDVMEAIGTADKADPEAASVHQTLWFDGKNTYQKQTKMVAVAGGGPASGFHIYAAEWRSGSVRWYVDGQLTYERDQSNAPWLDSALDGSFFLRLNLAVGGTFPGDPDSSTLLPADMVVDWVKVSQWR